MKGAAELLVLGQGLAPMTTKRQQTHKLPLALFLPGFQHHASTGMDQGLFVRTTLLIDSSQATQGFGQLAAKLLPAEELPFLKRGSVGQGKAFEEGASHQAHRLLQRHAAPGNRGHQALESDRIEPVITLAVELDDLAGAVQKGGRGRAVGDHLPEVGQGVSQVGPG